MRIVSVWLQQHIFRWTSSTQRDIGFAVTASPIAGMLSAKRVIAWGQPLSSLQFYLVASVDVADPMFASFRLVTTATRGFKC